MNILFWWLNYEHSWKKCLVTKLSKVLSCNFVTNVETRRRCLACKLHLIVSLTAPQWRSSQVWQGVELMERTTSRDSQSSRNTRYQLLLLAAPDPRLDARFWKDFWSNCSKWLWLWQKYGLKRCLNVENSYYLIESEVETKD